MKRSRFRLNIMIGIVTLCAYGCNFDLVVIKGKFSIDKNYADKVTLYSSEGLKKQVKDNQLVEIIISSKTKITMKRIGQDQDFWQFRFHSKIEPIGYGEEIEYKGFEIGQRYSLKIKRLQKNRTSSFKEERIDCYYRENSRTIASENLIKDDLVLTKGKQKAKLKIVKFEESYQIKFIGIQDKIIGKLDSNPRVIEKVLIEKILSDCH